MPRFFAGSRLGRLTWACLPLVLVGASVISVHLPLRAQAPAKVTAGNAPTPGARPALTVSVAAPQTVDWPVYLDASGSVAAWQEASVGARTAGLPLADVLVNVGDAVKRGQLLARFDGASVRAELAQAEAALAQAQAAANQAAANRDRALQLKGSGAISDQEILLYTTQSETARAQVAQSKAALDVVKLKLTYTHVVAPDDGLISARAASVGAVTQPGFELFKLIRQSRLEWRAELPPAQLSRVKPGAEAVVVLPDGASVRAKVRTQGPSLDNGSRLGITYVDLPATSGARAAMYVSGRIMIERKSGLVVPSDAIVIRDGRSYVFRQDGDRVRQAAVSTGRRDGPMVEILSGVTVGQLVVTRGAGFLNDNDLVRVVAGEAAGASGTAKKLGT